MSRQWIRFSPVCVGSGFMSHMFYVMTSSGPGVGSRPALDGVLRRLEKYAQSLLLFFVSCFAARTWKSEHHFYELTVSSFTQNGEVCTDDASVALSAPSHCESGHYFHEPFVFGSHFIVVQVCLIGFGVLLARGFFLGHSISWSAGVGRAVHRHCSHVN